MGLAGQDELTRKYYLPTLDSDNKLYMHTQNNNIAVLPKKKKWKQTNVCLTGLRYWNLLGQVSKCIS